MFKPTEKQPDLFGATSELSEGAKRRLEDSWAEPFRRKVWPVLLDAEEEFADLYDAETGRGCWSVARKLGMCILQEWFDLTDHEVVDRLSFDLRFQYALMLRTEEAYLSRQGLSDFRRRLVEADPQMERLRELLVRVAKAMGNDLELEFDEQRTDATHIESNIEVKGRAVLMAKTIEYVDRWVEAHRPDLREAYSEPLREWLQQESSTVFGGLSDEQYQAKLDELAEWAWEIRQQLAGDEEAEQTEEFEILEQLLDEQVAIRSSAELAQEESSACEDESDDRVPESGGSEAERPDDDKSAQGVEARSSPKSECTTLQSPYDPDAGYRGDKGTGYNVHITETCRNDEESPEAITDMEVQPMENDHGKLPGIVRRLHRAGYGPEKIYADGGYTSGMELLKIRSKGTEPICPVSPGNRDPERIGRHEFDIDPQTGRVRKCPAGEKPFRHAFWRSTSRRKGKALHALFYPDKCGTCPMESRCPVQSGSSEGAAWSLEMRAPQVAHDERVDEQESEAFQQEYKIRAGIEATASELKRVHGLGQLRIRRLPKVRMKATLKAIGCNIKRWMKALLDEEDDGKGGRLGFFLLLNGLFEALKRQFRPIADAQIVPNF
jgi:hypothetical protein